MNDKHKLCSIEYYRGSQPRVLYALYADDEDSPISMLSRSTWTLVWIDFNSANIITHSDIEVAISPEQAEQFHHWLSWFPEPQPLYIDISHPSKDYEESDNYRVILHKRYGEKSYHCGWGTLDFKLPDHNYDEWERRVKQLIAAFENLTGNINQIRPRLETAIEVYDKTFHNKGKYSKFQGRWTLTREERWQYPYTRYKNLMTTFETESLAADELRQIDYRHYLPRFLWIVAFQKIDGYMDRWNDPMLVFKKISETDFPSWDKDEQEALLSYFEALCNYVLIYFPPLGIDAYTFIQGVQLAGADVTPYVNHWKQAFDRVEVSRHLVGYVQSLFEQYIERGEVVFDEVPKILRRWLHDIAEGDYFLKRFMEYDGVRPFVPEFAEASDTLKAMIDAGL